MSKFKNIKIFIKYKCLFLAFLLYFYSDCGLLDRRIVQEAIRRKKSKELEKKYKKYIIEFNDKNWNNSPVEKKIWVCWFQGEENAPSIVKKCIESIRKNAFDWDLKIITSENYMKYANLPSILVEKWKKGIISNTHFSDLLRCELLIEHGGLWIDSTCLLTEPIPLFITNYPFFTIKNEHRFEETTKLSSWFMFSRKSNPILKNVLNLEVKYWEINNSLDDYYLFHLFFNICLKKMEDLWSKMPTIYDLNPHMLFYSLKENYKEDKFEIIISSSFIHKLTYKLDEYSETSYFSYLIKDYNV